MGGTLTVGSVIAIIGLYCMMQSRAVQAQEQETWIGIWSVRTERDRFSDIPKHIAMTWRNSGAWLAVRCMEKKLDLAVADPVLIRGLTPHSTFVILFRADTAPIVETTGVAVNDHLIEIQVEPAMRRQLLTGREYALRFEPTNGDVRFDELFEAGTASQALAPVVRACPVQPQ